MEEMKYICKHPLMSRNEVFKYNDKTNELTMVFEVIGTANSNGFFVVAQVDDTEVAFHIDSVVGIHKVEKEEIRDMGHFVPKDGYTDGAIRINKKLVILLNFENIVRDVNPEELTMQLEEVKIKEVFDE